MGPLADERDVAVVRRARLGDEDALGALVDAHAAALIGYLARLTGDFHQSEDIAQETFLRAFDNLDRFDTRRPFRPWLFRIGRNLALNWLSSKAGRERKQSEDIDERLDVGTKDGPEEALDRSERRRGVESVLDMLPVHFREVLHLRYLEGLEYDAIATELDLPLGTVKTWLHRAKQAFIKQAESSGMRF